MNEKLRKAVQEEVNRLNGGNTDPSYDDLSDAVRYAAIMAKTAESIKESVAAAQITAANTQAGLARLKSFSALLEPGLKDFINKIYTDIATNTSI